MSATGGHRRSSPRDELAKVVWSTGQLGHLRFPPVAHLVAGTGGPPASLVWGRFSTCHASRGRLKTCPTKAAGGPPAPRGSLHVPEVHRREQHLHHLRPRRLAPPGLAE